MVVVGILRCVVFVFGVVFFGHSSKLHVGMKHYGVLLHLGMGVFLGWDRCSHSSLMLSLHVRLMKRCVIASGCLCLKGCWCLGLFYILKSIAMGGQIVNRTKMDAMNHCFCALALGGGYVSSCSVGLRSKTRNCRHGILDFAVTTLQRQLKSLLCSRCFNIWVDNQFPLWVSLHVHGGMLRIH